MENKARKLRKMCKLAINSNRCCFDFFFFLEGVCWDFAFEVSVGGHLAVHLLCYSGIWEKLGDTFWQMWLTTHAGSHPDKQDMALMAHLTLGEAGVDWGVPSAVTEVW